MRKVLLKILVLNICLLLVCCSNPYNYSIEKYTLMLEPRAGKSDVKVTMEITYLLDGSESKSDGFKFVGDSKVDSLICTDETGIITSNVEYLKETKLTWQFNPVSAGSKTIKVTFILKNLSQMNGTANSIHIEWPGVFRVPVTNASYSVLFDTKPQSIQFRNSEYWENSVANGKVCYTYSQDKLKEKSIVFNYNF